MLVRAQPTRRLLPIVAFEGYEACEIDHEIIVRIFVGALSKEEEAPIEVSPSVQTCMVSCVIWLTLVINLQTQWCQTL